MSGVAALRRRLPRPSRGVLVALVVGVVVVIAVVVVLVVTSGPSSPGEVTFAAAGSDTSADPTVYCDLGVTDCSDPDADAVVTLPVPPGTDLAVTVPSAVASTPWQLAFTYRGADGTEQSGRSPVFAPGSRGTFTLTLPDPRAQLERVEVQQYGAKLVRSAEGVAFSTRSTWVLTVSP